MSEIINFVSAAARREDTGNYVIDIEFGDICMDGSRELYQVYKTSGGIIKLCQGWKKSIDDNYERGFRTRPNLLCAKRSDFSPRFLNAIEKWGDASHYFDIYYKSVGNYKYRLLTEKEIQEKFTAARREKIKQQLESDIRYEILEEIETFNRRMSEIKAKYKSKLVPVYLDEFDFNTLFDPIKDSINNDSE